MTPYRTPAKVSIPWWQRAWFWFDRHDAAQRWEWARRRVGGRWTKTLADCGRMLVWSQVTDCPASGWGSLGCNKEECFCPRVLFGMCHVRMCFCEVWPLRVAGAKGL